MSLKVCLFFSNILKNSFSQVSKPSGEHLLKPQDDIEDDSQSIAMETVQNSGNEIVQLVNRMENQISQPYCITESQFAHQINFTTTNKTIYPKQVIYLSNHLLNLLLPLNFYAFT